MRKYIRHPANIPIVFSIETDSIATPVASSASGLRERVKDVGLGGLCFCSRRELTEGSKIHLEIPFEDQDFSADGVVAWCREEGENFAVGVEFNDMSTDYSVRMIEQVCHIRDYKAKAQQEGRELDLEQAAEEWVAKHAANFP